MNGTKISIALAIAGIAGAQTPAPVAAAPVEDAAARADAKAAVAKAASAAATADSAKKASAAEHEQVQAVEGKVDGLNESYLETKATVAALSKFKVSGFLQFQYALASDTNLSGGYSQKQGAWALRRARLKFAYDAGNGAQLVWQPNFLESKFETKDAYIQYTEQWLKAASIRAGVQDIPFGFEIANSSSSMELIERSRFENNSVFNGEKTLGVVAGFNSADIPVNVKFGWLNGQTQQAVTGDWSATQDPKNFSGRLGFATAMNDLGLSIDGGASYFFDTKLLTDTAKGGSYKKMRNDSLVTVTGAFRKDMNTNVLGLDLQATYEIPMVGGFKLLGEYYQGKIAGAAGGLKLYTGAAFTSVDVREAQGYYVAGILNPIQILPKLQLVYRYDYFDPNTQVKGNQIIKAKGLGATDLAYTTNTLGANWFVNGNLKVSLFYDIVSNETTNDPKLNGGAGTAAYVAKNNLTKDIDDNVLTVRAQVAF
jgi:phosphate-selective porin